MIYKVRLCVFICLCTVSFSVLGNPQGGVVTSGSIHISQPNSSTVLINQSTDKGIINWQSFNIHNGETTQFIQPSSSSITLNRINGLNGPSSIFGNLIANGQVWLINPAGIVFGKSAQVNVGGLLATTSDIKDSDFLAGKYKFFSNSQINSGSIINNGHIQVQPGGLVALVGNAVDNKGVIEAKMGTVILGGAQVYTLDFDGDQLINFAIQQGPSGKAVNEQGKLMKTSVNNSGVIDVGVGTIMTPNNARKLVQNTINMKGITEANHVYSSGGVIILDAGGGKAKVQGKLLAKNGSVIIKARKIKVKNAQINTDGSGVGGDIALLSSGDLILENTQLHANGLNSGGSIKVLGKNITIDNGQLQANGTYGGGEILVGGNAHGLGPEPNASTTYIDSATSITADAITNGSGGTLVIWSDNDTRVYGKLSAQGGLLGGNGGWIETSAHYLDVGTIQVNTLAPNGITGTWLLDPTNITISNAATTNMNTPVGGPDTPNGVGATASTLNAANLGTQLNATNIIVTTTNAAGTSAGNITFSAATNFAANWANKATTLTLQADNNIVISTALALSPNNTLVLSAGNTTPTGSITISSALSGGFSGLTATSGSSGTITLGASITTSGIQNYNSPVILSASINLNGGQISMPSVTLGANTLTITTSSIATAISGVISGTGGLTKAGTGTLTLNNINTYTGATTISAGRLALGTSNAIGPASAVSLANIASAVFDLNNFNDSIGSLAGGGAAGGNVSLGSGTLTTGNNNSTTTYSGIISGSGGLTKQGTGTLTLARANTFTGATLVNAGTLNLTNANALGSGANQSSSITIASGATLSTNFATATLGNSNTLTLSGAGVGGLGALRGLTSTDTLNNPIVLNANSTVGGTGNLTLNGIISDGGSNYSLTKAGANTLTLAGINSYTGGTTINSGTLSVTNKSGLGTIGNINLNAGTLNLAIGGNTLQNASTLSISGGGALSNNGVAGGTDTLNNDIVLNNNTIITTAPNNATLALMGAISGIGGITKAGGGILLLSALNSYTGPTTINTGTVNVTNTSGLGGASGGTISLATGTTLGFSLGGATLSNPNTISLSGTAILSSNASSGITDTLTNPIILSAAGTPTIRSSNAGATLSLTGGITNNATTLTFNSVGDTGQSGVISGSGALTKTGAGTLTLTNANTYTGNTTVSGGTLSITNTNALGGAGGGLISLATGTTLSINLGGATLANPQTITMTGTANITDNTASGNADILNNPITLTAGGTPTISSSNSGASLTLNGAITNNNTTLTLNSIGDIVLTGLIGPGTGGIIKNGAGTLNLANSANTYTGQTRINNGTLRVNTLANGGAASSIGATAAATPVLIGSATSATLSYSGVPVSTNRRITINGAGGGTIQSTANTLTLTGIISNGGNLLTFDTNTGNIKASGVISGAGGLTKIGSSDLTLGAVNTYTGNTTVNAGSLTLGIANGISASSAVILSNTPGVVFNLNNFNDAIGSLAGGGALGGNVTLGSATLTTGGNNSTTTYSGVISGTGALTKSGTGTFSLTNANTYTGNTTVSGGTLSISNTNALGGAGGGLILLATGTTLAINLGGATLANPQTITMTGTANITDNTASGNADILNNPITLTAGGTPTISSSNSGASLTLNGAITNNNTTLTLNSIGDIVLTGLIGPGTGGIIKNGAGTLNLANSANTYTGQTRINNGTLRVNTLANGGAASSIGATAAATPVLIGSATSATLSYTGVPVSTNRRITINGAGGGTIQSTANTLTLTGIISNGGNLLTFDTNTGNITATGVISGAGGLLKTGSGILTLSNAANTYTGQTNISNGTLSVGTLANGGINSSLGATPAGTPILIGGTNPATLSYTGAAVSTNRQITINGSGGGTIQSTSNTLTLGGAISNGGNLLTFDTNTGDIIVSHVISGSGGLTKSGINTLTLNNVNTYTGNTTINAGTLAIGIANAISPNSAVILSNTVGALLNLNNFNDTIGSLAGGGALGGNVHLGSGTLSTGGNNTSTSYFGIISGTGSLTKSGSGTFVLANDNTYTGGTSITGGALQLGNGGTTGSVLGNILDNSVLIFNRSNALTYTGIISGTGSLEQAGTGDLSVTGINSYTGGTTVNNGVLNTNNISGLGPSGTIVINGGTLNVSLGGSTLQNQSNIILNGGTLRDSTAPGTTDTLANNIVLTNPSTINSTNAGATLALNGMIDGFSDLTIQGAGDVILNNAIGSVTPLNSVLIASNNTQMNGGSINTIGSQLYNTTIVLGTDSSLNSQNGDITFNGTINGAVNLTLDTVNGSIFFNSPVGDVTRLMQILITNTNNVGSVSQINSNTFIQQAGTGIANYAGELNDLGDITIYSNQIAGSFFSPFATISLNGISSLTGNVTANNLIVNGQNGGTLLGTVTNSASVGPGAQGVFTLNGQVIGAKPIPTPTPIVDDFSDNLNNIGVIINGILPYSYGQNSANSAINLKVTGASNPSYFVSLLGSAGLSNQSVSNANKISAIAQINLLNLMFPTAAKGGGDSLWLSTILHITTAWMQDMIINTNTLHLISTLNGMIYGHLSQFNLAHFDNSPYGILKLELSALMSMLYDNIVNISSKLIEIMIANETHNVTAPSSKPEHMESVSTDLTQQNKSTTDIVKANTSTSKKPNVIKIIIVPNNSLKSTHR